jgi:hypothetical protein
VIGWLIRSRPVNCREALMTRSFVTVSVVAIGAVGYAIAYWLANLTGYAERIDRERDHRQLAARSERLRAQSE